MVDSDPVDGRTVGMVVARHVGADDSDGRRSCAGCGHRYGESNGGCRTSHGYVRAFGKGDTEALQRIRTPKWPLPEQFRPTGKVDFGQQPISGFVTEAVADAAAAMADLHESEHRSPFRATCLPLDSSPKRRPRAC
jgi:hypothetical protein